MPQPKPLMFLPRPTVDMGREAKFPERGAAIKPAAGREAISRLELVDIERRVLATLCQGTGGRPISEKARQLLASHRWCEPAHQIVFEILMSLPATRSETCREQLPARLTRRGFPDFDFVALFNAPPLSRLEVERLIAQLSAIR